MNFLIFALPLKGELSEPVSTIRRFDGFCLACYSVAVGRANSPPAKPQQEVDNMQEDNGMNAGELQELKAALLKAERLEVLAILRDAESLDEAIKAIEQRRNG